MTASPGNYLSTGNRSHGHRRPEPAGKLGRCSAGQHDTGRPPPTDGGTGPQPAHQSEQTDQGQHSARWQPHDPRWLKATSTEHQAVVEFVGSANRLATIHQYGLKDRIKGREISYPARELLGMSVLEVENLENLIAHCIKQCFLS